MKTGILILLVFILVLSSARADDNSAALEKLLQIPPAPANVSLSLPKKLTLLVVKAQGVFINDSNTPVPFDQVLEALAALPKEAWPYGRVILYFPSPPGLSNPGDQPNPADVKRVEADLKAAGIQTCAGASA
jgi:hypothetical protein